MRLRLSPTSKNMPGNGRHLSSQVRDVGLCAALPGLIQLSNRHSHHPRTSCCAATCATAAVAGSTGLRPPVCSWRRAHPRDGSTAARHEHGNLKINGPQRYSYTSTTAALPHYVSKVVVTIAYHPNYLCLLANALLSYAEELLARITENSITQG